jgi:hypothetical protein
MTESLELQHDELCKQAKNFSYAKAVSRSKYNFKENCTKDVEELFSRMFEVDQDKRITFSEIRLHAIFKEYFPEEIDERSKIMYVSKNKMKVKEVGKVGVQESKESPENENVSLRQSMALEIGVGEPFPREKEFLFHKNSEIEFLLRNCEEFGEVHGLLTVVEKMPLCYNLLKYYLVLKRAFLRSVATEQLCSERPLLRLREFFATASCRKQLRDFEEQLDAALIRFETLHSQCADSIDDIEQINPKFRAAFAEGSEAVEFADPFKPAYRKSTLYVFNKLKKFMKEPNKGNTCSYFLALVVISHVFNRLFSEKSNVQKVFKEYLDHEASDADSID